MADRTPMKVVGEIAVTVKEMDANSFPSFWTSLASAAGADGTQLFEIGMHAGGACLYLFRKGQPIQVIGISDLARAWYELASREPVEEAAPVQDGEVSP